jgi:hypothetical protein
MSSVFCNISIDSGVEASTGELGCQSQPLASMSPGTNTICTTYLYFFVMVGQV